MLSYMWGDVHYNTSQLTSDCFWRFIVGYYDHFMRIIDIKVYVPLKICPFAIPSWHHPQRHVLSFLYIYVYIIKLYTHLHLF